VSSTAIVISSSKTLPVDVVIATVILYDSPDVPAMTLTSISVPTMDELDMTVAVASASVVVIIAVTVLLEIVSVLASLLEKSNVIVNISDGCFVNVWLIIIHPLKT
jgi:hypothetical protein